MIIKALKKVADILQALKDLGLSKMLELRKDGVHYARYQIFNKKWIVNYNINCVLDIGANVGEFALIFHHLFNSPNIHCFEPLPECIEILNKTTKDKDNITIHPYALGLINSKEILHVSSHGPSSSIMPMGELHKAAYPHSADSKDIEIECRVLDEVFKPTEINDNLLIKIDVQGFERNVIKGGEGVFSRAKIVVIEMSLQELYENEAQFDELYSLLINLGFVYRGSLKQSVNKIDDGFLQCDGIFVNEKSGI